MKKIFSLILATTLCGLAQATTINAPSNLIGSSALNGQNAYAWGVSIAVPTDYQVSSAQIDFNNITLTAANSSGTGYLYTDLINYPSQSATSAIALNDNDTAGDYFKTISGLGLTSLGTQFFSHVGTTLSWSYVLTSAQLIALNSYLTSGSFNIGIDPDCHYTVGGISITYTLGTTPGTNTHVPDYAATGLLFLGSLSCVLLFRRQFAAAK